MSSPDAEVRDANKLGGHLGLNLCEHIWGEARLGNIGGEEYVCADDEDLAALGYAEDDNESVVLMRTSDGAFFEIDIDVTARRVQPKGGVA
jgi:hypothetical protein